MSHLRTGPGLTALSRHTTSSAAYSHLSTQLSSQHLTDLRTQLDTFASALRQFAAQHRNDILKDAGFREEFQKMCAQIGVDPIGAADAGGNKVRGGGGVKGLWNNVLGLGDYYYELALQIVDVCLSTRDVNGGLIEIDELIRRVQRLRTGAAVRGGGGRGVSPTPAAATPSTISHDDVARAIKTLQPLGCGYTIVDLGSPSSSNASRTSSSKLVRSLPGALDLDSTLLLSLLASPTCPRDPLSGFAYLTEEALMAPRDSASSSADDSVAKPRWTRQRARNALKRMCDDEGTLWLDYGREGGEDCGRQAPRRLVTATALIGASRRPITASGRTRHHAHSSQQRLLSSSAGTSSSSRPPPPIRLILLDIFNTLLHPITPPAHQYASLARQPQYSLPPITDEAASTAFKAAMKRMLKEHPNYGRETLRSGADEWWKMVIRATVVEGIVASSPGISMKEAQHLFSRADSGSDGLSTAILHRFSAQGKGYKLFDDVRPFLSGLAERNVQRRAKGREGGMVRCVLASNSDERILGPCEALGLGKLGVSCRANRADEKDREGALLSYDLGYSKPSAEFFREALRLAGAGTGTGAAKSDSRTLSSPPLKGEEVLYVGDDLGEDARGARDSGTGIMGVWLDREGKGRNQVKEEGVMRVENLSEVLALVEEREERR